MREVIIVYADCNNSMAKGDFTLAGSIAKDLTKEIKIAKRELDVILTSTPDGIKRFENLYGEPINGRVVIEGANIGLCATELFDAVENKVVALLRLIAVNILRLI